jgi:hypothetical protein
VSAARTLSGIATVNNATIAATSLISRSPLRDGLKAVPYTCRIMASSRRT